MASANLTASGDVDKSASAGASAQSRVAFGVEGKPATFELTATVTSNGVMEGYVSVSGEDGQTHDFDGS